MISAGIGISVRDFKCILCQRHFSRMSADAILPNEMVCDECLDKLSNLDEEALVKHVAEALARSSLHDKELERGIRSMIQNHNQRCFNPFQCSSEDHQG